MMMPAPINPNAGEKTMNVAMMVSFDQIRMENPDLQMAAPNGHQSTHGLNWAAPPPSGQIPANGADKRPTDHRCVDRGRMDDPRADGAGDMKREHGKRDEIEEGGPRHRHDRGQHPGRYHRRNGIRRVMKPFRNPNARATTTTAKSKGERKAAGNARERPLRRPWPRRHKSRSHAQPGQNLFPLDNQDGIRLFTEQPGEDLPLKGLGFVLNGTDFDALGEGRLRVGQFLRDATASMVFSAALTKLRAKSASSGRVSRISNSCMRMAAASTESMIPSIWVTSR